MAYVSVAVEVDPAAITQEKVDALQAAVPGLVVQASSTLYFLLDVTSERDAINAQLITDVTDLIWDTFGAQIIRVPRIAATQATGESTWTRVDATGDLLIPAGTGLSVATDAGDRVPFVTRADATIADGDLSTGVAEVGIVAVDGGADGTGLQADPQPDETLPWLDTITVEFPTVGGTDDEDITTYRDRLADEATLMARTLVTPPDFATRARGIPGVDLALALDLYNPGATNLAKKQQAATTGSATLSVYAPDGTLAGSEAIAGGETASAMAATIRTALGLASGELTATGGPFGTAPVVFTYADAALGTTFPDWTMTGAGTVVVTQRASVATYAPGHITVAVRDVNGADPGSTIRDNVLDALEADSISILTCHVIAPNYTTIAVTFTAVAYPDFDPADVEARAELAAMEFLSPANWGLPPFGDLRVWLDKPIVRYRDIVAVIESVEGLDYTTAVTLNAGTADVTMTGPAALPALGSTATGTVVAP